MYHLAAELAHEHPPFKTHSIISYSSSVSLCLAFISPISNPLLQTMSAAAVTAASIYISEDRHLVLRYNGCPWPLRGKSRPEGRVDVSETWLWTACIFFIWDHALFYGCVCIVHMNNNTNSVRCIVCNCNLITLANSLAMCT